MTERLAHGLLIAESWCLMTSNSPGQSQTWWGLSFQCKFPRLGCHVRSWTPCSSGKTSKAVLSLLTMGCHARSTFWPDHIFTSPTCLSQCGFFFMLLVIDNLFFFFFFGRQSFILVFSYVSHGSLRYNCSIRTGGFCVTEEGRFQEFSALPSCLPPSTRVAFPLVCFWRVLLSYWKFHH